MKSVKIHPVFDERPGFDKPKRYIRMQVESTVNYPAKRMTWVIRNFLWLDLLEQVPE